MMRWTRALFILPLFLAIYTPASNHQSPHLAGIPFVIWFQFVIVVIGAVVAYIAYRAQYHGSTGDAETADPDRSPQDGG
jgi:hypothetical protein